jgi:hypothetical protein
MGGHQAFQLQTCFFVLLMPKRFEDKPWYHQWREALDRVIAAQMARDGTKADTPERSFSINPLFRAWAKNIGVCRAFHPTPSNQLAAPFWPQYSARFSRIPHSVTAISQAQVRYQP